MVRRGAKDPEPSVTLRFSDDKFGMTGGYDAEIFSDYIAIDEEEKEVEKHGEAERDVDDSNGVSPVPIVTNDKDDDSLLCRQGIKFSLRGPIPTEIMYQSSASTVIERTSTRKGKHETIGSATLGLGPFIRNLPLGARTSLTTSVTSGKSWR